MANRGFAFFSKLIAQGHTPAAMGFHGRAGDVSRLAFRIKLTKCFQGIKLDTYSQATIKGYDALFRIFLIHSALEQFLFVTNRKLDDLEDSFRQYGSEETIRRFFEIDQPGKIFKFISEKLTNKKLQAKLKKCRERQCHNIGYVSAAIRHIFVHGELSAHPKGASPSQVYRACLLISDFLVTYIDKELFRIVNEYWQKTKAFLSGQASVGTERSRERRPRGGKWARSHRPTPRGL
jgi:hypothetical protein